jgi:hypothetical protein
VLGEFIGGPLMIVLLVLLFRVFLRRRLVDEARAQADRGVAGRMEGHAEMDMSVHVRASALSRLRSPEGFTATSHYFVMDWAAIWIDIVGGLLIAGALASWVPESFWQSLFLEEYETLAAPWGPIVGPMDRIHLCRLDRSCRSSTSTASTTAGGWPATFSSASSPRWPPPRSCSSSRSTRSG